MDECVPDRWGARRWHDGSRAGVPRLGTAVAVLLRAMTTSGNFPIGWPGWNTSLHFGPNGWYGAMAVDGMALVLRLRWSTTLLNQAHPKRLGGEGWPRIVHHERLIALEEVVIRRECRDHAVVLGGRHLRQLPANDAADGDRCARVLHSTRTLRHIDPCRQSGVSHQSSGSAVFVTSTLHGMIGKHRSPPRALCSAGVARVFSPGV